MHTLEDTFEHIERMSDPVRCITNEGDLVVITFEAEDDQIQDIPVSEIRRFGLDGDRVILMLRRDAIDSDYGVHSTYYLIDPSNPAHPGRIHAELREAYNRATGRVKE
jgi:hypothetical protein